MHLHHGLPGCCELYYINIIINGLSGAGCYGVSNVRWLYLNFGLQGSSDQIYASHDVTDAWPWPWPWCMIHDHVAGAMPLANISNFPWGVLQKMFIISNETTVVVQSCLPSMIYAAKWGIWATTTVARFIRFSFRTHFKGASWSTATGCTLLLPPLIAVTCCLLLAAICRHSFYTCNA